MASEKRFIPLSVPAIKGREWRYVKECLDTGWVSSAGSYVSRFEEMVARYMGCKYSVATVNGTAALHLGLITCGVKPKDEVILPTLTFVAPANAVRYCGAYPVFMDSENDTLCLDVRKLADFLDKKCVMKKDGFTYNKKTKRRIKAVIPVHVFGHPVDMKPLVILAARYNITVIEDATESIGSEYRGRKTGTLGRIGCLSFNGNKIITTGGGGMVVTDNKNLARQIRHLSTQAKKDGIEYYHDAVGYNYRLTNIQAALGVAQLENLEKFIAIKKRNARIYKELLRGLNKVTLLPEKPWAKANFWFYTIKVPKKHKKPLIRHLLARNIEVRPIWKLMHTLPMYRRFQAVAIEESLNAYDTCINLPCSINLSRGELEFVAKSIKNYFKG